jgi:hypothetical protein
MKPLKSKVKNKKKFKSWISEHVSPYADWNDNPNKNKDNLTFTQKIKQKLILGIQFRWKF